MMIEADPLGPRFSHHYSGGQPPSSPLTTAGSIRHLEATDVHGNGSFPNPELKTGKLVPHVYLSIFKRKTEAEEMNKPTYVISSGWWCGAVSDRNADRVEYGSSEIRKVDFFHEWITSVKSFTSAKKILIVDSASEMRPDIGDYPEIEWVRLNENAGHSTSHVGVYSGVTRAHVVGMTYAFACGVDYWVYIEQDALIYGDGIVERAIASMRHPIMLGAGAGTPQPTQQSFMIMSTSVIPTFLYRLASINAPDRLVTPETKFAIATSAFLSALPATLFSDFPRNGLRHRIRRKVGRWLVNYLSQYDAVPFGYGRVRPISFDDQNFYFQHASEEELKWYRLKYATQVASTQATR